MRCLRGGWVALALGACAVLGPSCALFADLDGLSGAPEEAEDAGRGDAPLPGDDATATPDGAAADANGPALPTDPYAVAVLVDEPRAYLRFDETTGSIAKDVLGRANGTYVGAVGLGQPGVLGPDGGSSAKMGGQLGTFVSLGDVFDFAANAPFTFEIWMNPDVIDATYRRLAGKVGPNEQGWSIGVLTPLGYNVVLQSDGGKVGFGVGGFVSAKAWTHVVVTYDGSIVRTYRNGTPGDSQAGKPNLPDTAADLILGALPSGFNAFEGRIDELAIYGKALPFDRVTAHYAAAAGR